MRLATAESCTGGWIAKIITDLQGSSKWFEGTAVCYSNDAKHSLLGVPLETLDEFGAVSGETVLSMIDGIFEMTAADVAVAVSGLAGPGGGTEKKPVGTVWISYGKRGESSLAREFHFEGNRESIRLQAVEASLKAVLDLLD
jgi:nicotinamide-nucleotide amidase